MITLNLSQCHHLASQYNEMANSLAQDMRSLPLRHVFRVFEPSSEADLAHFRNGLEQRRQEYEKQVARLLKMLEYVEYLRNLLAEANSKCGISEKLTAVNSLNRQARFYEEFTALVGSNHEQNLEPVKNVDFYKSAFTDQNRVYELPVHIFNEQDWKKFERRLAAMKNKIRSLNDEIAALNQANTIELKTFEEFSM